MEILKSKDGFFWGNVTSKAKEIFNSGLFELYAVYEDFDYLINDYEELNEMLEKGENVYIELNYFENTIKNPI